MINLNDNARLNPLALAGLLCGLASAPFATAHAQDKVEKAADDAWITVSGTVVSSEADSFRMDYGDGVITVEMDDFDAFGEGYGILENDEVVVYGKVDHDLFEKKTIEASSVYVENLGTHFYANPADEEDFATWTVSTPVVVGEMEVTGTVTAVTGREFTVSTGLGRVQVDTMDLAFNPMDDKGFLQISVGDRVKVGGHIDHGFIDEHELSADWIIELQD